MNLAQFKHAYLTQHSIAAGSGHKVLARVSGLLLKGRRSVEDGEDYTCTLIPHDGKYLPRVISVTGTVSPYAFMYDYTTGVVYIPGDEIHGTITITAHAVDYATNIPAQILVRKITADTYDGENTYSRESFFGITIHPSRGSTVSVTFDGITKTVTDTLHRAAYNGGSHTIYFGTYLGESDGTTSPEGLLEISGAYDGYSTVFKYASAERQTKIANAVVAIVDPGCPRYITPSTITDNGYGVKVTYDAPIETIYGGAVDAIETANAAHILVFNRNVEEIRGALWSGASQRATVSIYLNNVDVAWWVQGNRANYINDYIYTDSYTAMLNFYINDRNISGIYKWDIPDSVDTIGAYAFAGLTGMSSITIPQSVKTIHDYAFYRNNATEYTIKLLSHEPPQLIGTTTTTSMGNETITYSHFNLRLNNTIVVPKGCSAVYKAAPGWSTFADIITEEE